LRLLDAGLRGEILFRGQNLLALPEPEMRRVRGAEISMIFQEPMTALNPVMKVGAQIGEALLAHGKAGRRAARAAALEMLRQVAVPDPERRLDQFPHQLSGGLRQRVMIAMALICGPALLIADEPTTALDVTIQAQILDLLRGLRQRLNLALLLISHDLAVVAEIADTVAVMYAGRIVECGPVAQVLGSPAHPYTRGLLRAAPSLRTPRGQRLPVIPGNVPDLRNLPPGCSFEPRCDIRIAECAAGVPGFTDLPGGRQARCLRAGEAV
jgi:oligopeptide/dipeptide ABC transporter ATP-binding protein